jgi:hypothetical protein
VVLQEGEDPQSRAVREGPEHAIDARVHRAILSRQKGVATNEATTVRVPDPGAATSSTT